MKVYKERASKDVLMGMIPGHEYVHHEKIGAVKVLDTLISRFEFLYEGLKEEDLDERANR